MSKYTQEQEVEIVRDAMNLTSAIEVCNRELEDEKRTKFKSPPLKPTRRVITPNTITVPIPAPPEYKFKRFLKNPIYLVLFIISLILAPFTAFIPLLIFL